MLGRALVVLRIERSSSQQGFWWPPDGMYKVTVG
jgi:hypothetical protein